MSFALLLAFALMISLVVFPPQATRLPRAVLARRDRRQAPRRF